MEVDCGYSNPTETGQSQRQFRHFQFWRRPTPWSQQTQIVCQDAGGQFDGSVINEYLEERYPAPALMPKAIAERARVREIEQFGDEAVMEDLLDVVVPYWTVDPSKRDTQRQEKARQKLRNRSLPFVEKVLAQASGEGICGAFSLADAPYMVLAMILDLDEMDLTGFPRLDSYLRQLRGRQSYRAISSRTRVDQASSRR